MKQAGNNEVDLLLRFLAKGRDASALRSGSASAGGNGAFSEHLDADELNSYAEGVAPAAARARYTEHLADCEACRRIVIDLSQTAGVANRFEVPQQQRGPGFWQNLAAVLSPAVLRYAVPALILTAVIGIGLLGLQQQRRTSLIARNERAADTPATSGELKQAEAPTGNSSSAPTAVGAKESESPTVNDSIVTKSDRAEKAADTPAPTVSTGIFGTATSAAKDGTPPGKAGEGIQLPPYAPEPKVTAVAPPPATVQSESDAMSRLAKEAPAKRENQVQERNRDDLKNQQPVEEHGPNRGAAQQSGPYNNSQRNVGGVAVTGSGPNAENKKAQAGDKKAKADDNKARAKASDVETRYVSGRRFLREENAWIDTAYESSRTTVNVKRGSEQFRALVADEPGLGAIADQLKGVVIVVWKSRAYRIH